MTIPSRYAGSAGSALAAERLERYAHYAELVQLQEAALDREDLAGFREIAERILALQEEIGELPHGEAEDDPELEASDTEASQLLAETMERVERVHARLTQMRHQGAGDVRRINQRRPQARKYVAEGSASPSGGSRLDIKL